MIFSSMIFLWLFLPVTLILYLAFLKIGKNKAGNIVLLLASLLFYAWGEPLYIFLMLLVVALNYLFGYLLGMEKYHCRYILAIGVTGNVVILGYFKYFNFFATYFDKLMQHDVIALKDIALPLGISFYTFQAMSYMVDVYRGEVKAQKNYFHLLLYISFFPQLIAGPIVKYKDIEKQLLMRTNTYEKRVYGVRRFIYGLGKKVLLANAIGRYVDMIFYYQIGELSTGILWLAMIFYTLQIYYDFSGYSDMAIGLSSMFGFELEENFRYPYISGSVREFWRRWHISLSTWFKEYVYIPLGGNRCGSYKTYRNLFIVFLLTGFWHGASMTFVFWGLYHGVFMILERIGLGKLLDKNPIKILNHIYTMLVVIVGWVFFRADGIRKGLAVVKGMFWYRDSTYNLFSCIDFEVIFLLLAAVLFSGILQSKCRKLQEFLGDRTKLSVVELLFLFGVLALSVMALAGNSYNPFLYFRF